MSLQGTVAPWTPFLRGCGATAPASCSLFKKECDNIELKDLVADASGWEMSCLLRLPVENLVKGKVPLAIGEVVSYKTFTRCYSYKRANPICTMWFGLTEFCHVRVEEPPWTCSEIRAPG